MILPLPACYFQLPHLSLQFIVESKHHLQEAWNNGISDI